MLHLKLLGLDFKFSTWFLSIIKFPQENGWGNKIREGFSNFISGSEKGDEHHPLQRAQKIFKCPLFKGKGIVGEGQEKFNIFFVISARFSMA